MSGRLRMAAWAGLAAVVVGLLALAFGDSASSSGAPPRVEHAAVPAPTEVAMPAAASAPGLAAVSAGATLSATPAVSPVSSAPAEQASQPSRPLSGPGSAEFQAQVESRLTRRLQGAHPLRIDGADLEIIGSQLPREGRNHEPYLAVRNVRTGEVDYWQSGLRFALQGGVDPETFIGQQTDMRRLFVGGGIAEVAVDAALVSGVFARLSADPRVTGVRLLPIPTQPTLR